MYIRWNNFISLSPLWKVDNSIDSVLEVIVRIVSLSRLFPSIWVVRLVETRLVLIGTKGTERNRRAGYNSNVFNILLEETF